MNEQEKRAVSQEERKEKIRQRYKGVDRSELEFIPARQREKLFEDTGTKRVCAYCRVSTDDANQTSSYELQKNHYQDMIKEHPGWILVDIYADEGISGTSLKHRDDFNRMIRDCQDGKIDLIVTKSVSRFARNIVDCIAKVRELADLSPQVGVFFETEHIYTLDNSSEMMLAVLSAAAQEESHTKSEIMNISIEQRFSRGIFLTPELLGYDKDEDGNLVINETEADTVRLCYYLFLNGFPTSEIAEILMELGRKTKLGNSRWTGSTVINVLKNERHCGEVLARKTYTPNYLDHKSKKNDHDRNQYRQTDHHEAIVSREIFYATQKLLEEGKYRKGGYPLPSLQVVDRGVLKGFVSVNRTWTGFSDEDYRKASISAYETMDTVEAAVPGRQKAKRDTCFDLSGYEIVRAQFFSTRLDPALTIYDGRLVFNTACMKKFENVEYVELLFNSVEKCIAVRPCEENNPNAIRWGTLRNGKWAVLPKGCKGFANPLYHLLGWASDRKYRLRGQYRGIGDEQMILFDLSEPEVTVKESITEESSDSGILDATEQNVRNTLDSDAKSKEELPLESGTKSVTYFPKDWAFSFGRKTDEVLFLERVKCYGEWDVLRPAKTVEGMEIITQEVLDDLRREAKALMERMRGSA
jgi:DNA invertase Pin-like site-specific DNA recombinase